MSDKQNTNRQPPFDRFATLAARWMGQGLAFGIAVLLTLGWAVSAPLCARGSLERLDPAGPDAADNLACTGSLSPGR